MQVLEKGFELVSLIAYFAFYQALVKASCKKYGSVSYSYKTNEKNTIVFKATMLFAHDSVGQTFRLDPAA